LSAEKSLPRSSSKPAKPPNFLARDFGRLKVRPKLVLLHNFFFFVLSVSVYLSVIPVFSNHIEAARVRELQMLSQIFAAEMPAEGPEKPVALKAYGLRKGSAGAIGLNPEGVAYLNEHPSGTWQQGWDRLFRRAESPGEYWTAGLSPDFYDRAFRQARLSLLIVLGTIYVLSVVVLEFLIMPQFVYRPLRVMTDADAATQRGDRENELIEDKFIFNDEIGQIMRSRNATIAQLRRHEDDLAQALRKLEEQDRLVSLGMLSTSVAHELNTPLAVLQGSIEKMLETLRDEHALERLKRMLRVTQRLRKISESLVDFARVRKEESEMVLLAPLIEESWNLVAIDEKAALVSFQNLTDRSHAVAGNQDRLIQVFVNLLRNALIAVSNGGTITVESRLTQRGGRNWVCCIVTDNGPGIPSHVLPNLFEAFVSTRLDARGTGLGLTVAEGIVTQHGGTITASNRPEGGAVLEVMLPASFDAAEKL
jgi:signal transduction histidine kinase